jgi:hypothetical protein
MKKNIARMNRVMSSSVTYCLNFRFTSDFQSLIVAEIMFGLDSQHLLPCRLFLCTAMLDTDGTQYIQLVDHRLGNLSHYGVYLELFEDHYLEFLFQLAFPAKLYCKK